MDLHDLYAVQRVSRSFQNTIAGLTQLQVKMFRNTTPSTPHPWRQYFSKYFFAQHICPFAEPTIVAVSSPASLPSAPRLPYTPVILNPVLRLKQKRIHPQAAVRMERSGHEIVNFTLAIDFKSAPSWQQSFLTDPPCKHAILGVHLQCGNVQLKDMGVTVDGKKGLRFADLFDVAGHRIVKQIQELEVQTGRPVRVFSSEIILKGVVVASTEDWDLLVHLSDDDLSEVEETLHELSL